MFSASGNKDFSFTCLSSAPSNHVASVFQLQISSLNSQAANLASSGNCSAAIQLQQPIETNTEFGFISLAVQSLGESIALAAIIVAFAASAVLSARRFEGSQLSLSSAYLKLQILTTSAVVFATFLFRFAFAGLNTYGLYYAVEELAASNSSCTLPCASCHSLPYIINRFLFFCPELRAAVVLLSSPIALLVACWGMTSKGKHPLTLCFVVLFP